MKTHVDEAMRPCPSGASSSADARAAAPPPMSYWKRRWDRHLDGLQDDDPCRQVGRTLHQQPMGATMFRSMLARVVDQLELQPDHRVLDLCCGNGLLSTEIAAHCRSVLAVDFSHELIKQMAAQRRLNVTAIVADAVNVCFRPASFDRILVAAAVQQFTEPEVIRLFERMASWLKPGGILLVTDVLDSERIWRFYDTEQRRGLYFEQTMAGAPILGTWINRTWLRHLACHAGFEQCVPMEQPSSYWYSHYRFDFVCRRRTRHMARG